MSDGQCDVCARLARCMNDAEHVLVCSDHNNCPMCKSFWERYGEWFDHYATTHMEPVGASKVSQ